MDEDLFLLFALDHQADMPWAQDAPNAGPLGGRTRSELWAGGDGVPLQLPAAKHLGAVEKDADSGMLWHFFTWTSAVIVII